MDYLEASAELSPCGLYRYRLDRVWDRSRDVAVFVMLNPSTADGATDDATIRKCVAFAKAWGCGRLTVVNLFAFRATEPDDLKRAADPVGPDTDRHIAAACAGRLVVCAWGAAVAKAKRPVLFERPGAVRRLLAGCGASARTLGLTSGGHPGHPLYVPGARQPERFDL